MPAFDVDSQSPFGSSDPHPPDSWAMPVGSVAGIRLFVSYSVFVALAVLAGLITMVQHREGNGDLPVITFTAVAIWSFGWVVQSLVQICLNVFTSAKSDSITIGLLGLELGNPLYRTTLWNATSNLMLATFSLSALVLFGAGCFVVHMLTQAPDHSSWSAWLSQLASPSFGLDDVANCYLTATWLFWIQAACQAFPLPRNLGRGAMASLIALLAVEADDESQIKLLRRFLQLVAIVTLVIASATMIADTNVFLPRWPILVALAVILWVSAGKQDLRDWITSLHLAQSEPIASSLKTSTAPSIGGIEPESKEDELDNSAPKHSPWISELIDDFRMRQKRRRARAALEREHKEADDVARLDQVLEIVSRHGTGGLSDEDKALLQRVSDNLRRDRISGNDRSGGNDRS